MKNPHAHHFTEHDTIAIACRSLMLKILCINRWPPTQHNYSQY